METQDGQNEYGGGDYRGSAAWPRPRYGLSQESQSPPSMPQPRSPYPSYDRERADASIARVVAIVVSAGLAWATAVTLLAWVLGRLLAHG